MTKPIISIIVLIIVSSIGCIFAYNYFNSVELTIVPKNISSYSLTESGNTLTKVDRGQEKTVRVPKFSTITVSYDSPQPYESNKQDIKIDDSPKKVTINPFYSEEHLSSLVSKDESQIIEVIKAYDSVTLSNYSLQDITLYHYGDWASVKIIWMGKYGQNTDNQRIILNKKDGKWTIAGQPSILFFYKNTPNIPIDILKEVNES